MSYKPVSESERQRLEGLIAVLRRRVGVIQGSIGALEQDLVRGAWVCDLDFSSLPMPKPNCYTCAHSTAVRTCNGNHKYGTVCGDYVHFSEER